MEFLNIKTTSYVTNKYIVPLIKEGRLEMTIPENQEVDIKNIIL